jgi:hypothetical protein
MISSVPLMIGTRRSTLWPRPRRLWGTAFSVGCGVMNNATNTATYTAPTTTAPIGEIRSVPIRPISTPAATTNAAGPIKSAVLNAPPPSHGVTVLVVFCCPSAINTHATGAMRIPAIRLPRCRMARTVPEFARPRHLCEHVRAVPEIH